MRMILYKAAAFIRRDFVIDISYRFAFAFNLLTALFPIFSVFFIARLVDASRPEVLGAYGGGYFPFALIGVALSEYFVVALRTFAGSIQRSQLEGCLEATLSTRTRPEMVVICSSIYTFGSKTVHVLLALIGGLLLGARYCPAGIPAALIILVLTVAAFSGLGILSAAFMLVFKKGQPIAWLMGSLNSLLGGALFPVAILPGWLKCVSAVLPMTYSLEAVRLAALRGHSLWELRGHVLALLAMASVLIPLGVFCFAKAVHKGRRDGSLMQY